MQKARRHIDMMLRLLVGARFQALFHSPPGVLFTFPSRYWFAIGLWRVFSLGGWARRIHTGFHVPRATQDTAMTCHRARKGLSPSMAGLSRPFRLSEVVNGAVLQPRPCRNTGGLG